MNEWNSKSLVTCLLYLGIESSFFIPSLSACGILHLSPLTRDRTPVLAMKAQSPNHETAREFSESSYLPSSLCICFLWLGQFLCQCYQMPLSSTVFARNNFCEWWWETLITYWIINASTLLFLKIKMFQTKFSLSNLHLILWVICLFGFTPSNQLDSLPLESQVPILQPKSAHIREDPWRMCVEEA